MPSPSKRKIVAIRGARRFLEYLCFLGGTLTRSQTLRIFGLRAAASRALARRKFERAGRYADELLTWAAAHPDDRNCGNAIHHGYTVRGQVALEEGKLDQACSDLHASAQTRGSPQLNSFGPNMQLAERLLDVGRRDAVLEYLDSCHAFWEMGEAKLDTWMADIRRGKAPAFEANLAF